MAETVRNLMDRNPDSVGVAWSSDGDIENRGGGVVAAENPESVRIAVSQYQGERAGTSFLPAQARKFALAILDAADKAERDG